MSVAIKDIPGVENVEVSLNEGKARIRLNPGNTVTLEGLRKTVKDAGFTAKEARITALGAISIRNETPKFAAGQAGTYSLVVSDRSKKKIDQIRLADGVNVILKGIISGEPKLQDRIEFMDFEVAPKK